MSRDTIQTLWVGQLSPLEKMCLRSFVRHGHPVHLYTYGEIADVPAGVEVKDANEIVLAEGQKRFQNLANFSDFFRYSLLLAKGNWWVDSDVYCLKPFDLPDPYVFATQLVVQRTADEVTSCVIKTPQGSEQMQYCLGRISKMDTMKTPWSAIGPGLMVESTRYYRLGRYVRQHEVFCPLNYFEAPNNVMGPQSGQMEFWGMTYAVHLWNEESRRAKVDKSVIVPGSLYEKLNRE